MSSSLYLTLSILLAGDATLANGIRVVDLPGSNRKPGTFEAVVGYRAGFSREIPGAAGLAKAVAEFLKRTPSARAMAVAAYGAGGTVEYFSDLDRTGIRVTMPDWARSMVEDALADFLSETPQLHPELVDRGIAAVRSGIPSAVDLRSQVESRFQNGLLGSAADTRLSDSGRDDVQGYFTQFYGTDRAFVLLTGPAPKSLEQVTKRPSQASSAQGSEAKSKPFPAYRIQSELDEGAVIAGAPSPAIYYRNWFALLMFDRLIPELVPVAPATELHLSLAEYYYRMEFPVVSGQTVETAEAELRESLSQLQYTRAAPEQLERARQSALKYLASPAVEEWFLSLGVAERRQEGMEWVRTFNADDMRVAARNLVEEQWMVAGWSPRVRSLRLDSVQLKDLSSSPAAEPAQAPRMAPMGPVRLSPFPPHSDRESKEATPEKLASGVSIVPGWTYAVFVAPDMLQTFSRPPSDELLQTSFGEFRAQRILVMAPPESFEGIRNQWQQFRGNLQDGTPVAIQGNITSVDVPGLLILKMLLDRRSIEAGLFADLRLEVRAAEGSTLRIHGSEENRQIVAGWLKDIAAGAPQSTEMDWAREAAIHHFDEYRADLQSLVWLWNPEVAMLDLRAIPASQIQDIARTLIQ